MSNIFLSYAREDREAALAVASNLTRADLTVWFDEKLRASENYHRRIQEQIDQSKAVMVIWSQYSIVSEWVLAEATRARNKLIQVHTDSFDKDSIPIPFNVRHCVPLSDLPQIIAGIYQTIWSGGLRDNVSTQPGKRPFTRLRVKLHSPRRGVHAELIDANSEALAFYGADRLGALIGLDPVRLINRLSPWMSHENFEALRKDQIRAAHEFGRHQWAAARVPARLNSAHPSVTYRNNVFRPVMQTVLEGDNQDDVFFAEVSYIQE